MSTLLGAHCICFCFVANGNKYVIPIRISGNQTEIFCYDAVVKYGKYVKWSVNIKTIENGLFANKWKLICSKRLSRIYFKHIGFFCIVSDLITKISTDYRTYLIRVIEEKIYLPQIIVWKTLFKHKVSLLTKNT